MVSPDLLLDAGPFGWLSVLVALCGVGLAVAQVAQRHRRSFEGAIAICAGLSLLFGIAGTGLGLRIAADALQRAPVVPRDEMWRVATGIAWSCTSIGALGGIVDLLALGAVGFLRPVRSQSSDA